MRLGRTFPLRYPLPKSLDKLRYHTIPPFSNLFHITPPQPLPWGGASGEGAPPQKRRCGPAGPVGLPASESQRGRRAIFCPVYLENPWFSLLTCHVLSRLPHLPAMLDAATVKNGQKCRPPRHAQRRSRQKWPKVPAVRFCSVVMPDIRALIPANIFGELADCG